MIKGINPASNNPVKRPAMLWYPGDHLRDTNLSACSFAAQGFWVRMICLMHDMRPYGVLSLNGKDIPPPILARMIGASLKEANDHLAELESAGVFSRSEDGLVLSRRMVRDEALRRKRADGGAESEKHPNVPRRKRMEDPSKDPLNGSPHVHGPPGSSRGSLSLAEPFSFPDSVPEAGSSMHFLSKDPRDMAPRSAAAAANENPLRGSLMDLPKDLLRRLLALGVSEETGHSLLGDAGSAENLRFALDRVDAKKRSGEVQNASGLLIRRVGELAQEGRGTFEAHYRGLESELPDAFRDPRWKQLPESCRLNQTVVTNWATWWRANASVKAKPMNQDTDCFFRERDAWKSFLESCLEFHPEQETIRTDWEQAIQALPEAARSSFTLKGTKQHLLAKGMGLIGTPVDGVAS
jgi:hypothetical protein